MPNQAQVPDDDPMMIAWEAYRATEEARNTFKWARHIEVAQGDALQGQIIVSHPHTTGSLWAAFVAGYQAALSVQPQQT